MATFAVYEDPVEYANRRGVRYPEDCRCAGCPWHYDYGTACDCDDNPTIGSLCPRHARHAGLRIGPSAIAGRGVFAQYRTDEPYAGKPRVVFKKGSIVGYYGGVYRIGSDNKANRIYYGPQLDRYMLSVSEYSDMRDAYPPHKPLCLHKGPTKNRYYLSREHVKNQESEDQVTWDVDAVEPTASMLRYANDPVNTIYKANVSFKDAYLELEDVQLQKFLEGKPFFVGDAKIMFPRESINFFLTSRSTYVSREHVETTSSRFAVPGNVIVAKCDIHEGEEILISYGDGYWEKIEEVTESEETKTDSEEGDQDEDEEGGMLFSNDDSSDEEQDYEYDYDSE